MNEWMNEWMKSRGWENNKRALLQYILTCEQQARTSAYKGSTGSRSQSICELAVPTQPMMWMMRWVKVDHNTEVYVPYSFSNSGVGSFTSHKNQISVSAVRRGLRFFVLIRED